MTLVISHAKVNAIADWTQADLDAQIALGNYPPGTVLADIVLPSDWNAGLTTSMATNRILGRATASTGAIEELTPTGTGSTPVLSVAPTMTGAVLIGSTTGAANSIAINTNVNGGCTLTSSAANGPNYKLNQVSQTNYEFYNNGGNFGVYNGTLGLTIFALSGSSTTGKASITSGCRFGWANSTTLATKPLDTHMDRAAAGVINFGNGTAGNSTAELRAGNIKAYQAGNGFYVKEGTNATMGRVTLVAGTATVPTTKVTANSEIFLTRQSLGGTPGMGVDVTARTPGTDFTITAMGSVLDTSDVSWIIIEPA